MKPGAVRQSRPELVAKHTDRATALLVHPSRPLLFGSGFRDHAVWVRDLESRSLLRTLAGHTDYVCGLALDPGGTRLASGSNDRSVRLWDLDSGKRLCKFVGHSSAVISVAWEATGSLLASGSWDKTVRVWHADSGALRHTLEGHSDSVYALAAHPDASADLFASGSEDQSIRIWRWSTGLCLHALTRHTGEVFSLAASKEWLVSGSGDWTLRVWSWNGCCARVLEATRGSLYFNLLVWQGSVLIALDFDGRMRAWDTGPSDPSAWSSAGLLKEKTSCACSLAMTSDGRVVFNAPDGLVAVALETPARARARRRRLARSR